MRAPVLPGIVIAGAAGILLAACAVGAADALSDALPTLRIGHVGHDHQLALYVAALESEARKDRWGIYLHELKPKEVYELVAGGRPVARLQLLQTEGGAGMPAAMSRGEFDVGLGSTIAAAKFADSGKPLKIICPLQTDGDQLVLREGLPIAEWGAFVAAAKTGAKPLRIGYKEPMAVAKMIFECALKAEGVSYGYEERPGRGVVLVNFGSEKSPLPLLESRALDGFVMNQPGTAMAVHKGLAHVVAELRDLPPKGTWAHHPCCSIIATPEALEARREPIKALLELIILSTKLINEEQALAIDCAVRWTKNPRAVEARSVPTVSYLAQPTERWVAGLKTWLELVRTVDFFKGKYARVSAEEFVGDICAFDLCAEAIQDLRKKGLLEAQ